MSAIVRSFINCIFGLSLVLLCSCHHRERALPFYNTPDFTPVWIPENTSPGKIIDHRVGNFSFTDQAGESISEKNVAGRIHVANFMFTSCGSICPKMMTNLLTLQKEFRNTDDVVLLSYSVTPWKDSVPRLKKYADQLGIETAKWHLLTGNTSAIYELARRDYFAEEETGFQKDSSEFLHTEHFLLVDRDGYLRGVYNGTLALEAERLAEDIKELLKE